ncbi:M23 family metallopeptidase [uncultured Corynebacterium sp.]|uniref:M23 family metallopeptidase n=1 Tax=uncultured Corynebacterium sp. TaxID=159447 RepID=UPI0025FC43E2|nr:M23 family metallopeptidase [uncultured Corynebacterium sp.]
MTRPRTTSTTASPRRPLTVLAVVAVALLTSLAPLGIPWSGAAPDPSRATTGSRITDVEHSPPVPGGVVTPYDPPPQRWLPGHRGVDLAAPVGAVVRASGDGTVHFAGEVAGRPTISVMHADGIRTTYQPVRAEVRRGDRVRRGDVLGRLEAGPDPGLHWGALRGDDYLNPMDLLRARPIVLKPVRPR